MLADLLGLLRRCGLAGADGPDGLIGDDDAADLLLRHTGQRQLDLHGDPFLRHAGFPLCKRLAAADDRDQARIQRRMKLCIHVRIRLAHGAALGVTEDDIFAPCINEHIRGDLAGIGTGGMRIAVLCTDGHACLAHGADCGRDAHSRDAQRDITPAALRQQALQLGHERLRLRRRFIHFPVTGNERFAIFSVHSALPLSDPAGRRYPAARGPQGTPEKRRRPWRCA